MLDIRVTDETRCLRIACIGRLDAESVRGFVAAAVPVIDGSGRADVVADLSGLVHVDSSGVGALSHLFRRLAQAGRKLGVEGLSGQPLALFRATGLDSVLAPAPRRPARGWIMLPAPGIFERA